MTVKATLCEEGHTHLTKYITLKIIYLYNLLYPFHASWNVYSGQQVVDLGMATITCNILVGPLDALGVTVILYKRGQGTMSHSREVCYKSNICL